jgi:hypothetical protein
MRAREVQEPDYGVSFEASRFWTKLIAAGWREFSDVRGLQF